MAATGTHPQLAAAEAHEQTDGNPLLLYHLARDPSAPSNSDIDAYYARLWATLPYSAQEVASLIALSIRPLDLAQLEDVSQIGIPEVRKRLDSLRGLITQEAGTYRLFHPTFRDFVATQVAEQRLASRYYRRLADVFRDGADRVGAAHHLLESGIEESAQFFLDAASTANVEGAWIQVERFARHVLEDSIPLAAVQTAYALLLQGIGLSGVGQIQEAEQVLKHAVTSCCDAGVNDDLLAEVYAQLGWLRRNSGRLESAREYYEQAAKVARNSDDTIHMAALKSALGQILLELGDAETALQLQQEVLNVFRGSGNRRGESLALLLIGNVHMEEYRDEEALDFYRQAEVLGRELGLSRHAAAASTNMGVIYRRQARYADAWAAYEHALAVNRTLGDRRGQAVVYLNMGNVKKDQENLDEAEALYRRAIQLSEGRFSADEGLAYRCLADTCWQTGQSEQALAYYRKAIEIHRMSEDRQRLGHALLALARALVAAGDFAGAAREYHEAADAFSLHPENEDFSDAVRGAVTAAERACEYRTALDYLDEALTHLPHGHESRLPLLLDRARFACYLGDGSAAVLASQCVMKEADCAGRDDLHRMGALWRVVGFHIAGNLDEMERGMNGLLDDAIARNDRGWLQSFVTLLEHVLLTGQQSSAVRTALDRIWEYLGDAVMGRDFLEEGARCWQIRLNNPPTLRLRFMDFSEEPVTAFLAEQLALRICLSEPNFSELLNRHGPVFDQFVSVAIATETDVRTYIRPSDLPVLDDIQPITGTLSQQDDPTYRLVLVTVRDDFLALADPRAHLANRHRWVAAATVLRSLLQLATGVDTDETRRACAHFFAKETLLL